MAHTITTDDSKAVVIGASRGRMGRQVVYNNYRIRKLTPKECWRLMGCTDEDFHKAEQVNSNSQLYKQAGNAIVVDVLEAIFKQMFFERVRETDEYTGND